MDLVPSEIYLYFMPGFDICTKHVFNEKACREIFLATLLRLEHASTLDAEE